MTGLASFYNCKHCCDSECNIYKNILDNPANIILLAWKAQRIFLSKDDL